MGASNTKLVFRDETSMMLDLVRNPTVEKCQTFLKRNFGSKHQAEQHFKNVESLYIKIGYTKFKEVMQRITHFLMKSSASALEGGYRYGVTISEMKSLLVVAVIAFVVVYATFYNPSYSSVLLFALYNMLGVNTVMAGAGTLVVLEKMGVNVRYLSKLVFYDVFNSVSNDFKVTFQVLKRFYTNFMDQGHILGDAAQPAEIEDQQAAYQPAADQQAAYPDREQRAKAAILRAANADKKRADNIRAQILEKRAAPQSVEARGNRSKSKSPSRQQLAHKTYAQILAEVEAEKRAAAQILAAQPLEAKQAEDDDVKIVKVVKPEVEFLRVVPARR
jgi:hypothetical protein